jgi:hypothetical protein
LEVYDNLYRLVYAKNLYHPDTELNIRHLSPGLYLVRLRDRDNIEVITVIKQ